MRRVFDLSAVPVHAADESEGFSDAVESGR